MSHLVSKLIYETLHKNNVNTVFLYTGGAIMGLIDHFHKSLNNHNIKTYTSANEQNLMASAIGYARVTGKPATVIVTSGPGILNCVTHIFDSFSDGVPIVILSGQVPLNSFNKHAFQASPSIDVMKPITKQSILLTSTEKTYIENAITSAYITSMKPRNGPVFIDIPKCILNSSVIHSKSNTESYIINKNDTSAKIHIKSKKPKKGITAENIKLIKNTFIPTYKKPIIIIGKGCADSSAEITKFARKNNIPITSTLHGLGIYNENNFLSLQMHGLHGNPAANIAIQNADLIMAFGSRFDDRTVCNPSKYSPMSKKILINNEKNVITSIKPNIIINDTCKNVLNYILKNDLKVYKTEYDKYNWLNAVIKSNYKYKYGIINKKDDNPYDNKIHTKHILFELNKQLHRENLFKNTLFVSGVGNHQMLAAQYLKFTKPNQFLTSGSLGVMGCAVPYSIGAKIADPSKHIITLDGDGNFNMSLNDLKTALTYNIPIKIIVFNNSSLNMVRSWENIFHRKRHAATDLINPNFNKIADAYGIKSLLCANKSDLEKMINIFIKSKTSIILNAITAKDELCNPMVDPRMGIDTFIDI
jgi:acetolactate synthase I/II/III large subunit